MDQSDINMLMSEKEQLKSLLDKDDSTDCLFIIGKEELKAHKRILTYCSPVFEKMFYGKMASDRIIVADISPEDFMQMLRFIYTGCVKIESVLQAWSLFYAAHKYLLNNLAQVCTNYVQKNLSLNTLVLSLEFAEMYEIGELQKICMEEIVVYIKGLFHKHNYYHMKSSSILAILEQPVLNISNYELVEGILQWAVDECDTNSIVLTAENIVNLLNSLKILQYLVNLNFNVDPKANGLIVDCCQLIRKLQAPITPSKIYLTKQWCTFCRCRQTYKIAGRMELRNRNVLISNISVNRNVLLYGLVLVTADETLTNKCNVDINIEICPVDNPDSVMRASSKITPNEAQIYVPFSELVYLESGTVYSVSIAYTNLANASKCRCSILCNYMSHKLIDEKKKVIFSFDELNGGVIKGICYYPM